MHTFYYTEETIDFSVKKGDKQQAIKAISKVYPKESSAVHLKIYEEKHEAYQTQLQNAVEDNAWNVFTKPETRGAAWICWVIAVFNNMSGIGIINIFSTAIFENIKSKGAESTLTLK